MEFQEFQPLRASPDRVSLVIGLLGAWAAKDRPVTGEQIAEQIPAAFRVVDMLIDYDEQHPRQG